MQTRREMLGMMAVGLVGLAGTSLARLVKAEEVQTPSTLDNLLAVFNSESNASNRDLAFAKKADEEGYSKVAQLFRAVAHSEQVHAQNFAAAIKKMKGTPKATLDTVKVDTTTANLGTVLKAESFERDTLYAAYIAQATKDGNRDALRCFNYSKAGETAHAKMYQDALAGLDQWKSAGDGLWVCEVCGYIVYKVDFKKCPICYSPKEKYTLVG